jgi:hypothetical protein
MEWITTIIKHLTVKCVQRLTYERDTQSSVIRGLLSLPPPVPTYVPYVSCHLWMKWEPKSIDFPPHTTRAEEEDDDLLLVRDASSCD